jgi:D-sedoheptulose 7-phosphate isomerase
LKVEREQISAVPVAPAASVPLGAPARELLAAPPAAPSVSEHARVHVSLLQTALSELPLDGLERLSEVLFRAYRNDKQVFTLGNGGSSSTASHMAADLAKITIGPNMPRFRIMCLSDNVSIVTALANDVGYENILSEQLKNHIRA